MTVRTTLTFPVSHPACDGHFPALPVLPAVVLLDEALCAIETAHALPPGSLSFSAAKFLHPVQPGETLVLEHEPLGEDGTVRFRFTREALTVASGVLRRTPRSDTDGR